MSKFYHLGLKKIDDSFDKINQEIELVKLRNMAMGQLDQVRDMFQNLRKDFDIFE